MWLQDMAVKNDDVAACHLPLVLPKAVTLSMLIVNKCGGGLHVSLLLLFLPHFGNNPPVNNDSCLSVGREVEAR